MPHRTHTIRPFRQEGIGWTFITIGWDGSRLALSGVEGPQSNGNCRGSCGQLDMHEWHPVEYAPGYDAEVIAKLRDIWGRYHLNDMQAGTPAQTAYLREHPVTGSPDPYKAACAALTAAGLNPDGGYRYGSSWLHIDVPQDVIDWLFALPPAAVVDLPRAWRN